ncbi:hypothetical protein COP1_041037 [Malus domestica]
MPYQGSGSHWYAGGESQNLEGASSSGTSTRQPNPTNQGRGNQGRGNQGQRSRQQAQGQVNHITLQDAQNNPDLIMGTLNLEFSMHRGEVCYVGWEYQGYPVLIENVVMPANLLHYYHAKLDCYQKVVTFHQPDMPIVTFVGERSSLKHGVIFAMRAKQLLSKGCQGSLAHVVVIDDSPA